MYINQFKYLCMIAQTKSINAAAEKLFISQQSLSKAMKALEDELNCALFIRNSKGVELTEDGERVLSTAKIVTEALEDLEHHFATNVSNLKDELNFLSTPYFYKENLSSALVFFRKNFPNVDIHSDTKELNDILLAMEQHAADFAFISSIEVNNKQHHILPNNLFFTEISKEKMYAVFSKDFPCMRYQKPSLKTMFRYPMVVLPSSSNFNQSPPMQLAHDFSAEKILEANSAQGFIQLLSEGIGWALVPQSTLPTLPDTIIVRPIKEHIYVVNGYLVNKNKPLSELSKQFIEKVH